MKRLKKLEVELLEVEDSLARLDHFLAGGDRVLTDGRLVAGGQEMAGAARRHETRAQLVRRKNALKKRLARATTLP